jgi:hypothetical protein
MPSRIRRHCGNACKDELVISRVPNKAFPAGALGLDAWTPRAWGWPVRIAARVCASAGRVAADAARMNTIKVKHWVAPRRITLLVPRQKIAVAAAPAMEPTGSQNRFKPRFPDMVKGG